MQAPGVMYVTESVTRNITHHTRHHGAAAHHFIDLLDTSATCADGWTAVSCDCDTGMNPAFKPLAAAAGAYDAAHRSWLNTAQVCVQRWWWW